MTLDKAFPSPVGTRELEHQHLFATRGEGIAQSWQHYHYRKTGGSNCQYPTGRSSLSLCVCVCMFNINLQMVTLHQQYVKGLTKVLPTYVNLDTNLRWDVCPSNYFDSGTNGDWSSQVGGGTNGGMECLMGGGIG
jgi:hypothetical protein